MPYAHCGHWSYRDSGCNRCEEWDSTHEAPVEFDEFDRVIHGFEETQS